jgi:hypothetical protein
MALTTHLYLAPRLKKDYSCTPTPLWAVVACCRANFTLWLLNDGQKFIKISAMTFGNFQVFLEENKSI